MSEGETSSEDAREFVHGLLEEARMHRALAHPYLESLAEGTFPDPKMALCDLALQYLPYSNDFLRYMTATLAQLERRSHREQLVHNLMEETGHLDPDGEQQLRAADIPVEWVKGVSHPLLYRRFLDALGMDKAWRSQHGAIDDAHVWRQLFLQCCSSGGPAQALGALGIGTEMIVKHVYRPVLHAIDEYLNVTAEQRVFFDVHAAVDESHAAVVVGITVDYARYPNLRSELRKGVLMALNLRMSFYDTMMARAIEMAPGDVQDVETAPELSKLAA